jgi:hypothetical protein
VSTNNNKSITTLLLLYFTLAIVACFKLVNFDLNNKVKLIHNVKKLYSTILDVGNSKTNSAAIKI